MDVISDGLTKLRVLGSLFIDQFIIWVWGTDGLFGI